MSEAPFKVTMNWRESEVGVQHGQVTRTDTAQEMVEIVDDVLAGGMIDKDLLMEVICERHVGGTLSETITLTRDELNPRDVSEWLRLIAKFFGVTIP